jgi:predicted ATP-dependent endonuclease of OLD family
LGFAKLSVRFYGPFETADIDLAPLTILTGPNVIGKSFLLRAIHAMFAPCVKGYPDVSSMIARLCNDAICTEPQCLSKLLFRGSKALEIRLSGLGYSRGLRYNAETNEIESLDHDCTPSEAIFVSGTRIYFTPYTYLHTEQITISTKPLTNIISEYVRDVLEKIPGITREEKERVIADIIKSFEEARDITTLVKALMRTGEALSNVIEMLSKQGVNTAAATQIRNVIIETFNSLAFLYANPSLRNVVNVLKPMLYRSDLDIEIGEVHKVKLRDVVKEASRIIEDVLFPEVKQYNIALPGLGETPSNIQLLPSGILHIYPLTIALVYAEKIAEKGAKIVLLIEEPELGLDFKRQRMLAKHVISMIKKLKDYLIIAVSTHSTEMLISLTREAAEEEVKNYVKIYEILDRKAEQRIVTKSGAVYIKHMFEELAEIYGEI